MTGQPLQCDGAEAPSNVSDLLAFLVMVQQAAALSSSSGDVDVDNDNVDNDAITFDPKTYVDLPLKGSLTATISAFYALPRSSNGSGKEFIPFATLQTFIADYFDPVGSEVVPHKPSDFTARPPGFLPKVHNAVTLNWAYEVHEIWPTLSRKERGMKPGMSAMIPLKNPFVIPGARFREVYYWDSYWVIRGLIVSKMVVTARGMVENMLSLVESYGFVPNGARTYYLNRSQPPLLSEMVRTLLEATGDLTLVVKALPILIREHSFWTSPPHLVRISDGGPDSKVHSLSRYFANWDAPRPESATIDMEVARRVAASERTQLYKHIASAAETGWDFSSRWMEDKYNLSTTQTARIVPTDLNAFLYRMEKNIELFARLVGEGKIRRIFARKAEARRVAIDAILWNQATKQWNDYWLPQDYCDDPDSKTLVVKFDRSCRNNGIYASNFVPLWCGGGLLPHDRVAGLVAALKGSGLLQPAGIATSGIQTGQQWDFPNGWAPLQHMIIEGLCSTRSRAAKHLAEDLAVRWLRTNYATFVSTGSMQEKFDVRVRGVSGGGGEYSDDQTGFGWSNGVVLALLDHFGWPEDGDITTGPSSG